MEHTIPELDRKGLREFGLVTGATLAILFGLVLPWLFSLEYPRWPWVVGGVLAAWGLIAPDNLRPVYKIWMRFALLLSKITTPIVMGIVFFLVVTPVALFMRIISRDPMSRRFDKSAESYRIPSRKPPRENMEKPF